MSKKQALDLVGDFLLEQLDGFERFVSERGRPSGMAMAMIMAIYSAARTQECCARLGLIPTPAAEMLVREFIGQVLAPGSGRLAIAPLYSLFQAWCLRRGFLEMHIPSQRVFARELLRHGQHVESGGVRFVTGLILRSSLQEAQA